MTTYTAENISNNSPSPRHRNCSNRTAANFAYIINTGIRLGTITEEAAAKRVEELRKDSYISLDDEFDLADTLGVRYADVPNPIHDGASNNDLTQMNRLVKKGLDLAPSEDERYQTSQRNTPITDDFPDIDRIEYIREVGTLSGYKSATSPSTETGVGKMNQADFGQGQDKPKGGRA